MDVITQAIALELMPRRGERYQMLDFSLTSADVGVYRFQIKVFRYGVEIDYTALTDVRLIFIKPDNNRVEGTALVDNAGIYYDVGTTELQARGIVIGAIQFWDGNESRLTSARFGFTVMDDPLARGAWESKSDIPWLQALALEAKAAMELINEWLADPEKLKGQAGTQTFLLTTSASIAPAGARINDIVQNNGTDAYIIGGLSMAIGDQGRITGLSPFTVIAAGNIRGTQGPPGVGAPLSGDLTVNDPGKAASTEATYKLNTNLALITNPTAISDANDLNLVHNTVYYTSGSTLNVPISASPGFLSIMRSAANNITQFWYRYRDKQIFIRQNNTALGGWGTWTQLALDKFSRVSNESASPTVAPWFKVASIVATLSITNYNIILDLFEPWMSDAPERGGRLHVSLRTGTTITSTPTPILIWQYVSGYDPRDFELAYSVVGNSVVAELWMRETARYRGAMFSVVAEGTRTARATELWTLYSEPVGAATPTPGYTRYTSILAATRHPEFTKDNILHNGYFRNLFNPRGQTVYTAAGYTIARWRLSGSGSVRVNVEDGYLRITRIISSGGSAGHDQLIEFPNDWANRTVTISILYRTSAATTTNPFVLTINDGTGRTAYPPISTDWNIFSFPATLASVISSLYVRTAFASSAGINEYMDIAAIMLERGSISTLANGLPADHGQTLLDCLRFERLYSTPDIDTQGQTSPPMRITPTVTQLTSGANAGMYLYDANL